MNFGLILVKINSKEILTQNKILLKKFYEETNKVLLIKKISDFYKMMNIVNTEFQNEAQFYFDDKTTVAENEIFSLNNGQLHLLISRSEKNRCYNPSFDLKKIRIKIIFGVIQRLSHYFKLGLKTFFCSVNLLDFFLSNYSFKNHQLITLSFATLVLASKLLESSKKVILFSEIKPFMISNQETNFLDLERKILCHMNFNVNTVSSYDFLMYLLTEFFEERFFFFFPL